MFSFLELAGDVADFLALVTVTNALLVTSDDNTILETYVEISTTNRNIIQLPTTFARTSQYTHDAAT